MKKRMYELLSAAGNLVSFDLEKVSYVKSCLPEKKIQIHFERDSSDLIISLKDEELVKALVADISMKKENYHEIGEENDGNS